MTATYQRHGHVGIVTIENQARRNALSTSVVQAILRLLDDPGTGARAFVVTSAGPVFSAGADLKEISETGWIDQAYTSDPDRPTPIDLFERLEAEPRPVIAAINGSAWGGGVELAISCDLALADETATFALPELGHGALPNTAVARLPDLIGSRRALELILTRRRISATKALALGLINATHPGERVLAEAVAMAESIISAPPHIIALVKRSVGRRLDWTQIRHLLVQQAEPEWREGTRAFVERRRPDYEALWAARAEPKSQTEPSPAPSSLQWVAPK